MTGKYVKRIRVKSFEGKKASFGNWDRYFRRKWILFLSMKHEITFELNVGDELM